MNKVLKINRHSTRIIQKLFEGEVVGVRGSEWARSGIAAGLEILRP